ncbi:DUF5689 domain-containing protein [Mesonia aestuariivivens]|uniref:Choice-of-anchor J domain-containing protein n=1 Tax=Mesonia aestuariivivens TaxID=2796128 RepID=A0ABS6VXH7_9FLAO|nr:DUF5689 domain-containing protein [Mesonia aestuariivivens]MBW2960293.1 choice-of-anchor J domain-containing protein [Mesonia aestuariivivens]
MKTIQKIKFLSFFLLGAIVTSCVQDDDFDTPEVVYEDANFNPSQDSVISIASVIEFYGGFEPKQINAGSDSDKNLYMEGYVVSSDETGNFYKTLIVQDKPENPTAGISISTDAGDLYTSYEPGRKVYLRVNGLYSGEYAGLPTVGVQNNDEVGRISTIEFENRMKRTGIKEEIIPTVIGINQTGSTPLNTLIKLEDVQFISSLEGESYANIDNTNTENRTIENCSGNEILLRNSGYSDFKNKLLPTGNGSIVAVLSAYNDDTQLFIRNTEDVIFEGERCGEEPGNGGGDNPAPGLVQLPFTEDFEGETAGVGVYLAIEGWTNVNVNGGERIFEVREFGDSKYAQTSAYSSDESPYEAWLVTSGVDLSSAANATLSFETKDGYYNGDALTAYISTDFDGDVSTANWTELSGVNYSAGNADGYGDNFVPSGDIDLSAYAGQTVYVGFKYLGASDGVTSTYQIDNISITAN